MTIVTTTYLELLSLEQLRPAQPSISGMQITESPPGDWQFNRSMYLAVGTPWAWNDKRTWSDDQWQTYVQTDQLRTFAAYENDQMAGYYELRQVANSQENGVEIAYFGLLPAFIGRGLGGVLLTSAIQAAWEISPTRVWVQTCSLDHPAALANYQARGMKVYKVESTA